MKLSNLLLISLAVTVLSGCQLEESADLVQQKQQEVILKDLSSQTGMPAIKNGRERKLLKDIIEMRDQEGLTTFTYLVTLDAKLVFLCDSFGYGIPASTQYTSPQKVGRSSSNGYAVLPQADPNGLFSPGTAEGTWVMCKDPNGDKVKPVYVEPRIITTPFKLG